MKLLRNNSHFKIGISSASDFGALGNNDVFVLFPVGE